VDPDQSCTKSTFVLFTGRTDLHVQTIIECHVNAKLSYSFTPLMPKKDFEPWDLGSLTKACQI